MSAILPTIAGILGGWLIFREWWGILAGLGLGLAVGVGLVAALYTKRSGPR